MDNRYSARSLTLRLGHRQIVNDVSLQLRPTPANDWWKAARWKAGQQKRFPAAGR